MNKLEKTQSAFTPLPEHEEFEPDLRRAFEFAHETVDPSLVDHSKVKMAKDSLLLSGDGTFYTLQGEGPTMGLPCVFCRLHVCNLRCVWCDAWYTWNPNTKEFWTEPKRVSFEEAAERISKTWACESKFVPKRVIFTGGEPLIQRKQIEAVADALTDLDGPFWFFEVETNGTLMPTETMIKYPHRWQYNCSPKLENSANKHHSMVKPKVLQQLNELNTTFKFVCYDERDLDEIFDKYVAPDYISEDKIIIMPQGIRSEEIDENMRNLYEPCMNIGWRLLGRMQAQFADGARRAV